MSNVIKKHYKVIIAVMLGLVLLPLMPIVIEIIFKTGNIVGTLVRQVGTNGLCF